MKTKLLMSGLLGAALWHSSAMAQDTATPPPPCSTDEYRQLDFWVGDWHAEWDYADGSIGTGENHITRDEYGDCVIYERFTAHDFVGVGRIEGMSVSTYFAPMGVWRQTWVDDQGGYFALTGGPVVGEDHIFALENTRLSDTAPYLRMIWEDVEADSFTWRWQSRASENEDWADSWVIRYSRMEEADE